MDNNKKKNNRIIIFIITLMKKIRWGIPNNIHYIRSLILIKRNARRIDKKIQNQEVINVVFIVQYIPGWNKLESIYLKMKEDKRFAPVIICVPLNIKNHQLQDKKNDTYEYFINHRYEAINALQEDATWYKLERLKPDYVFHSRPYNDFMPLCYTSGKIRKYALICNVLYGASLTVNGQQVVLNKNYFRDVYGYFAFDKSEEKFYEKRFSIGCKLGIQKCWPYGAVGLEQILHLKTEKKNSQYKKTVLWTPRWSTDSYIGGSNFFNYKDAVFELAKQNKDILFIFRPHPLMFGNFIKTGEMDEKQVLEFKKYCEEESNIILDESKEYADKFWNSDLLITDASGIVPEYFITEKPILYCHSKASFIFSEYAKDMIKSCYEVNDEDDLNNYLYKLICNEDDKLNDRKKCIKKYFGDVEKCSANILNALQYGEENSYKSQI